MTVDLQGLAADIALVTFNILKRFPGCNYTIFVTAWTDGTRRVECRHGTAEGGIHSYQIDNGVLEYRHHKHDAKLGGVLLDEFGNEFIKFNRWKTEPAEKGAGE